MAGWRIGRLNFTGGWRGRDQSDRSHTFFFVCEFWLGAVRSHTTPVLMVGDEYGQFTGFDPRTFL
jgi:hypothetical protein